MLAHLDSDNPAFNMPLTVSLRGRLDVPALARSYARILERHEILRSRFRLRDGQAVQEVLPSAGDVLGLVDLAALPPAARQRCADRHLAEEASRPFDLARGPVARACLIRLDDHRHVLLLTLHHIAADGGSVAVLVRELVALYQASPLPELPLRFSDFAAWQRRCLEEGLFEPELDYWRRQLAGVAPTLELPTDQPRPGERTYRGAVRRFTVDAAVVRELEELARQQGATLVMTLLAGLKTVLYLWSGQEDLVVGIGTANRTQPETERLVGCFFNLLALRTELAGDLPFSELLARVRETALGAYAHQALPFEKLLEALEIERHPSYPPLVQVLVEYQHAWEVPQPPDLEIERLESFGETAKLDLTFFLRPGPGGELVGHLEYNVDLFTAGTIGRMVDHLKAVLEQAAQHPETHLDHLAPVPASGGRELTAAFSEDLTSAW